MFVHDGAASVQAGAGIVADSDPDDEDLECHNKAAALLAAVPAARRDAAVPVRKSEDPDEEQDEAGTGGEQHGDHGQDEEQRQPHQRGQHVGQPFGGARLQCLRSQPPHRRHHGGDHRPAAVAGDLRRLDDDGETPRRRSRASERKSPTSWAPNLPTDRSEKAATTGGATGSEQEEDPDDRPDRLGGAVESGSADEERGPGDEQPDQGDRSGDGATEAGVAQ